jgi:hypothetical protein
MASNEGRALAWFASAMASSLVTTGSDISGTVSTLTGGAMSSAFGVSSGMASGSVVSCLTASPSTTGQGAW